MKVLMVNLLKDMEEQISFQLISKDYFVNASNDAEVAIDYLKSIDYSIIFIDGEHVENFKVPEFIYRVRSIDPTKKQKIIILSNNTNNSYIRELMLIGIDGFISKQNSTEQIVKKALSILTKISIKINEKRNHIRVDILKEDTGNFSIRIPNIDKIVMGKVINISMGGALFKLDMDADINYIDEGMSFFNVQIQLNKWLISCDINIIVVRKNLIGVKYTEIRENFQNYIAKYIFNRIANLDY